MAKTTVRGGVKQATTRKARRVPGRTNTIQRKAAATADKITTMRTKAAPASGIRRSAGPAPTPSKDELRAQVERLERLNAGLRTRNRELKRAAVAADERIANLEAEVRSLGRRAARETRQQTAEDRPVAERDPGDAVPSGVAVQEPAPLSEEDRKVLEHLNEELSPE